MWQQLDTHISAIANELDSLSKDAANNKLPIIILSPNELEKLHKQVLRVSQIIQVQLGTTELDEICGDVSCAKRKVRL